MASTGDPSRPKLLPDEPERWYVAEQLTAPGGRLQPTHASLPRVQTRRRLGRKSRPHEIQAGLNNNTSPTAKPVQTQSRFTGSRSYLLVSLKNEIIFQYIEIKINKEGIDDPCFFKWPWTAGSRTVCRYWWKVKILVSSAARWPWNLMLQVVSSSTERWDRAEGRRRTVGRGGRGFRTTSPPVQRSLDENQTEEGLFEAAGCLIHHWWQGPWAVAVHTSIRLGGTGRNWEEHTAGCSGNMPKSCVTKRNIHTWETGATEYLVFKNNH